MWKCWYLLFVSVDDGRCYVESYNKWWHVWFCVQWIMNALWTVTSRNHRKNLWPYFILFQFIFEFNSHSSALVTDGLMFLDVCYSCLLYCVFYEVWLLNNETVLVENKPCCVSWKGLWEHWPWTVPNRSCKFHRSRTDSLLLHSVWRSCVFPVRRKNA
jgi:hypothetical protein